MQNATNEFNHCYVNITTKDVTAHLKSIVLLLYPCLLFSNIRLVQVSFKYTIGLPSIGYFPIFKILMHKHNMSA